MRPALGLMTSEHTCVTDDQQPSRQRGNFSPARAPELPSLIYLSPIPLCAHPLLFPPSPECVCLSLTIGVSTSFAVISFLDRLKHKH